MLVSGLYAPAGQFLPPLSPGHDDARLPDGCEDHLGVDRHRPGRPIDIGDTFCSIVGLAHRNSPVCRSSV